MSRGVNGSNKESRPSDLVSGTSALPSLILTYPQNRAKKKGRQQPALQPHKRTAPLALTPPVLVPPPTYRPPLLYVFVDLTLGKSATCHFFGKCCHFHSNVSCVFIAFFLFVYILELFRLNVISCVVLLNFCKNRWLIMLKFIFL